MKILKLLIMFSFINCIVSGDLMICTDMDTGQSWTILTSGGH